MSADGSTPFERQQSRIRAVLSTSGVLVGRSETQISELIFQLAKASNS